MAHRKDASVLSVLRDLGGESAYAEVRREWQDRLNVSNSMGASLLFNFLVQALTNRGAIRSECRAGGEQLCLIGVIDRRPVRATVGPR
jgi:hypothetical protein